MATQLLELLIAALFAAATATIAAAALRRVGHETFGDRMRELGVAAPDDLGAGARRVTLEEIELRQPLSQRVLWPAARHALRIIGRVLPGSNKRNITIKLAIAGTPRGLTAETYLGLQLVMACVFALISLILQAILPPLIPPPSAVTTPIWTLVAGVAGYFAPELWLRDKSNRRKKVLRRALPDMIDLLSVSVAAGLAFDSAIVHVCQKASNPFTEEFERYLTEIRLGYSRRDALRQVAARTGVEELDSFISAFIQADQLGVSIATLLRVQSEQLRTKRRQRAEQIAQKAPLKMLFPMIIFIFPSVFVVILGPAVHQLMTLGHH